MEKKILRKRGQQVQEFYQGKKILVTGHTGFKGAWMCWMLSALGAEIYGFALPPKSECLYERARPSMAGEALSDIRDRAAVQKALSRFQPDLVFHLAGHSYINGSYEYPADIFEINVMGTVGLLDAIRCCGRKVPVVVVTSDKCYARQMSGRPCRETDPFGAADAYSTSKACQDLAAQSYQLSFPELSIATARASNTIGGGDGNQARLIPHLLNRFISGQPAQLRHPNFIRPWQYVQDVLWGYLTLGKALAEERLDHPAAFNFGPAPDGFQTVGRVAELLSQHFPNARCVWQEDDGSNQTEILRLDSGKAGQELGWVPIYTLEETLLQTAEFHQGLRRYPAAQLCREQTEQYLARMKKRAN